MEEAVQSIIFEAVVFGLSGMAGLLVGTGLIRKKMESAMKPLFSSFKADVDKKIDFLVDKFEKRLSEHEKFEENRYALRDDLARVEGELKGFMTRYQLDRESDVAQRSRVEGKLDVLVVRSDDEHSS